MSNRSSFMSVRSRFRSSSIMSSESATSEHIYSEHGILRFYLSEYTNAPGEFMIPNPRHIDRLLFSGIPSGKGHTTPGVYMSHTGDHWKFELEYKSDTLFYLREADNNSPREQLSIVKLQRDPDTGVPIGCKLTFGESFVATFTLHKPSVPLPQMGRLDEVMEYADHWQYLKLCDF